MPSVHHDAALEALNEIKTASTDAASFVAALSAAFPSWRGNAAPMRGYGDPEHHAAVIASRCLHDSLPVPFNSMKYNWEDQHGFATVMVYAEQAGRTKDDIKTLLDSAIAECEAVAA